MQLTVGQIYEGYEALARLLQRELEAPTAFVVAHNFEAVAAEYNLAQPQHLALIQRHGGTQRPGTGLWELKPVTAEYQAELAALLAVAVEVAITPLALEQLQRRPGEPAPITPADLLALDWMWTKAAEGAA